jgi:hypothetical protein
LMSYSACTIRNPTYEMAESNVLPVKPSNLIVEGYVSL